jgi:hypothetical protein
MLKDFRPISLLGCHYKIIFKILANSLKSVVLKGRSVMTKGLRSAQQVSNSSQDVHLL